MKRTASQRIADALVILCGLLILCDLLLIVLSPALAYFRFQDPGSMTFDHLLETFRYDFDDGLGNLLAILLGSAWRTPEAAVLAGFLILAGVCAGGILVQGIRLLTSVADGAPFSPKNPGCLRRCAALSSPPAPWGGLCSPWPSTGCPPCCPTPRCSSPSLPWRAFCAW